MLRRNIGWVVTFLAVALGGCEAVVQFDESKIGASEGGTGGAGGTPPPTGTTSQGGGGAGGAGGTGGATPECSVAEDCPAPTSECILRTCESGSCGTANVDPGTPLAAQTAGDCQRAVCDGHGAITTENDDNDPLDDGNDCIINVCTSGLPSSMSERSGTPCDDNGGKVCNAAGLCVPCNVDADCTDPNPPSCQSGQCVGAPQGSACTVDSGCFTGLCVDGVCCDSRCTGLCMSCRSADTSLAPGVCGFIACGDPDNECRGLLSTCQGDGNCGAVCI